MRKKSSNSKRKPLFACIILLCIIALVVIAFQPIFLAKFPWVQMALYLVIFLVALVDLIQSYTAAKEDR